MNIQTFGEYTHGSLLVQFIDIKEKGMSKGEFTSVASANGGMEVMIN